MGVGRVLVTGGASGLGAAIVAAVRDAGGAPLVIDKQLADGDAVTADVSDSAATEEAVRALADRAGGLDAVVTAAGVDACGPFGSVSTSDWERVLKVNLLGTAATVRAALPYLEASHGRVVTIASTLGLRPAGDATAYCASKSGVIGFSRALALETAGRIGVCTLIPGGMRTTFFDGRDEQYMPPSMEALNRPEDVAATVVHVLTAPRGCEVRELVICPENETSWP